MESKMKTIYTESKQNEKEFRKLAQQGAKLGIPVTECFLQMEVLTPDGDILHSHKQRSHSWVRNAYNALACSLLGINDSDTTFGAGNINGKDTAGTVRHNVGSGEVAISQQNNDVEGSDDGYRGALGSADWGIVVGLSDDAESFEDYNLHAPCLNGVGTNQFNHIEGNIPVKTYDAGTKTYSAAHSRFYNNNSGADIVLNETGIICKGSQSGDWYGVHHKLECRDVLVSPVTVPDGGQLKVTYTISLVYPA
jgi:hypothetical protein